MKYDCVALGGRITGSYISFDFNDSALRNDILFNYWETLVHIWNTLTAEIYIFNLSVFTNHFSVTETKYLAATL